MSEARRLAEGRMREVSAMPLDALVELIEQPVEVDVAGPSGRMHRCKTYAFWDMEPEESDLYVRVEVNGRGLRRFQRYVGVETRYPDNRDADDERDPGVSSAWTETFAWGGCGLAILALLVPWILGIRYLITRFL